MTISLQDQLLKAGLVNDKKAKAISKEKRKSKKASKNSKQPVVNDTKLAVEKARAEKVARDKALNMQRKAEADKKALAAQVVQMITRFKIDKGRADTEFNFTHENKIKKIFITKTLVDDISCGRLCIALLGDHYEVIPKPIAEKIRERDPGAIVKDSQDSNAKKSDDSDDDYYAQFEIPDDLMW